MQKEHGSYRLRIDILHSQMFAYHTNFFFLFFKDKIICLLVRQSQYTVINYRGLRKKYKNETLVTADSFDVRKEFLGIIMCRMGGGGGGGGDENAIKTKK